MSHDMSKQEVDRLMTIITNNNIHNSDEVKHPAMHGMFKNISNPPSLTLIRTLHSALCLDLDGTVRYNPKGGFINGPKDVKVFSDADEKLWEYKEAGWLIFGISNQGGVAHGFKTPAVSDAEVEAMISQFKHGNPFDIIKCCYHDVNSKTDVGE